MSGTDSQSENDSEETGAISGPDSAEIPSIDPICKMKVLPSRAAASAQFGGTTFYFCNPRCKQAFLANPKKYASRGLEESGGVETAPDKLHSVSAGQVAESKLRAFYLPQSAFDYTCPMDSEIRQKEPGSCPICGMDLQSSFKSDLSEGSTNELNLLQRRFLVAALFTVLLLSVSMPGMLGFDLAVLPHHFNALAQLLLVLPVIFYAGSPLFLKALEAAKLGRMNMFSLISFGVLISFAVSLVYMLAPAVFSFAEEGAHGMLYFESAASIITLVLLGQILESKARQTSGQSLQDLFNLAPSMARRENLKEEAEDIPVYEVKKTDRLRVLPGDRIPVDGLILDGRTTVDESVLTGNNLPVLKSAGDRVLAGTINGEGRILMSAEAFGRETVFAQIAEMLAGAQQSRSPLQDLADKVSAVFIPAVLSLSGVTFFAWLWLGGKAAWNHAIQDAVSVLVIACPCALGLATPLAVSTAVTRAAGFGLMVKDARALEKLATVEDFLIDKTGTLTNGKFELCRITVAEGISEDEALGYAASLEQGSKHPLALAILEAASARKLTLQEPLDLQSMAGLGLKAVVGGKRMLAGNAALLAEEGVGSLMLETPAGKADLGGATRIYLCVESELVAVFSLSDRLKTEAKDFISSLRELGVRARVLSGDNRESVLSAAAELQVEESDLCWGLLPRQKVEYVVARQKEGRSVAMIGDGVNDAAALAIADAGIAMASGSDVALHSAGITIVHSDLGAVLKGIKLGRLMRRTMKENLFLAFVYNAAALLAASGIFYPAFGIELSPAIAAAAMSLSSFSVLINSSKIAVKKF